MKLKDKLLPFVKNLKIKHKLRLNACNAIMLVKMKCSLKPVTKKGWAYILKKWLPEPYNKTVFCKIVWLHKVNAQHGRGD